MIVKVSVPEWVGLDVAAEPAVLVGEGLGEAVKVAVGMGVPERVGVATRLGEKVNVGLKAGVAAVGLGFLDGPPGSMGLSAGLRLQAATDP